MQRQPTIQGERRNTRHGPAEHTAALRADLNSASAAVADLIPAKDVEAVRPGSGMLVVTRGPNIGSQFRLDRPVMSAGRHQLSDIYLDDITVSRRHAEFRREGNEFRVVDCGSRNNTFVNREPVESAILTNGDEIQIGKFRLVFIAT